MSRGPELATPVRLYWSEPNVLPEVPHETNIDVRCHGPSAGVQRRARCADELGEQAFFAHFNAGICGADWLGDARYADHDAAERLDHGREINACSTATRCAQHAVGHAGKSATGSHTDGVSAVRRSIRRKCIHRDHWHECDAARAVQRSPNLHSVERRCREHSFELRAQRRDDGQSVDEQLERVSERRRRVLHPAGIGSFAAGRTAGRNHWNGGAGITRPERTQSRDRYFWFEPRRVIIDAANSRDFRQDGIGALLQPVTVRVVASGSSLLEPEALRGQP